MFFFLKEKIYKGFDSEEFLGDINSFKELAEKFSNFARGEKTSADLETGNGMPIDGRKIKGTIHWLSSQFALDTTVHLYDYLFDIENVDEIPEGKTFDDYLNRASVTTVENAKIEPELSSALAEERFQFVRCGYFVKDSKHANVFNRIVGLKDSFPKTK